MPGTRVNIDLFFLDMTPAQVNQQFPALLPAIKAAKARATKINDGKGNEEMSVTARYHTCNHDINQPCEAWIDI